MVAEGIAELKPIPARDGHRVSDGDACLLQTVVPLFQIFYLIGSMGPGTIAVYVFFCSNVNLLVAKHKPQSASLFR